MGYKFAPKVIESLVTQLWIVGFYCQKYVRGLVIEWAHHFLTF